MDFQTELLTDLALPYLVRRGADDGMVLVLAHGFGANEGDLFAIADSLAASLTVICPRAPLPLMMQGGYAWFELSGGPDGVTWDAGQARRCLAIYERFVEGALALYAGGTPERVILGGFSQGAGMSGALLIARPDLAGAALLLSGIEAGAVLNDASIDGEATRLSDKQVLLMHGTTDEVVPFHHAQATRELLRQLGADVALISYPMGHELSYEQLADIVEWLQDVGAG